MIRLDNSPLSERACSSPIMIDESDDRAYGSYINDDGGRSRDITPRSCTEMRTCEEETPLIASDSSADAGRTAEVVVVCPSCYTEERLGALIDDTKCLCGEVLQSNVTSRGYRLHVGQDLCFMSKHHIPTEGIVYSFKDADTVVIQYKELAYRKSTYNEEAGIEDVALTFETLLSKGKKRQRTPRKMYSVEQEESDEDGAQPRTKDTNVGMSLYKHTDDKMAILGRIDSYNEPVFHVLFDDGTEEDFGAAAINQLLRKSYVGRMFYLVEEDGEAVVVVQKVVAPLVQVEYRPSGYVEKISIEKLETWTGRSYLNKMVHKIINGTVVDGTVTLYQPPNFTVRYKPATGDAWEEKMTAAYLFRLILKCFIGRDVKTDFGEMGIWKGKVISFNTLYYGVEYSDKSFEEYTFDDIKKYILPPVSTLKKKSPGTSKSKGARDPPSWQAPASNTSAHLFAGLQPLYIEVAGKGEKSNFEAGRTFFSELFSEDRVLILKQRITGNASVQRPPPTFQQFGGCVFSLAFVKKRDDGTNFMGISKECFDFVYVLTSGPGIPELSVSAELSRVADFASIKSTRKLASRLELLHSSSLAACPPARLTIADIELIDDTISAVTDEYMGDGCGFIGEDILYNLLGGSLGKLLAIQVRIFSPKLGIWKGMLCKKPGIKTLQLTPSMRKVMPSVITSGDNDWVSVVVVRCNPSSPSVEKAKLLMGKESTYEHKKLSKMVQNLWQGLGCSERLVYRHVQKFNPEHSWLVGLADPTYCIPEGHIFVTGFNTVQSWATLGRRHEVFVTRSPCVLREHGRMLPVVVSKPPGMTSSMWDWLLDLPFGGVIFSTAGNGVPLAATCASGDLDGDLYLICWDLDILRSIRPCEAVIPPSRVGAAVQHNATDIDSYRNNNWFRDVQTHMTDPQVLSEYAMIGKLYRQMEKLGRSSAEGMSHPDYIAYAKAYMCAIDSGKHDLDLGLPDHLKAAVGIK